MQRRMAALTIFAATLASSAAQITPMDASLDTTSNAAKTVWGNTAQPLEHDDDTATPSLTGTVEHLHSPSGIATLKPRFSWQIASIGKKNLTQLAYNLRIDAIADVLGDYCNSGDVQSSASTLVSCVPTGGSGGAIGIRAGRVYWWTVNVQLRDGSSTSLPAQRFSTGLQERSDWAPTAGFIGLLQPAANTSDPDSSANVVCPWLRSGAFHISHEGLVAIGDGANSATLSVASIGWHEAYLNGKRLEEASVLIPSVSDLHHRVLSHQYVIDAKILVAGANVLAFWMAPGWSQLTWPDKSTKFPGREWPGVGFNVTRAPLVMAEMRVCSTTCYACDCSFPVTTNGTSGWKAKASSIEHTGAWQWGNYGGELLDHRLDLAAWSTTAPTAGWANAAEYAVDKRVTPESLEAMESVETLPASGVAQCVGHPIRPGQRSCYVVSLPRLINGFFEATELPGLKPGETATLTYSANCLSPCPTHPRPYTPCAPPTSGAGVCTNAPTEWHAVDTVVAGASSSSFANKFNWHTFQYVIISSNSSTMRLSAADLGKLQGKRITNAQEKI